MNASTKDLMLAQAVSELAALLEYRGQTQEATILRGEANTIATGRSPRGLGALAQLNRIRGGIQTAMKLTLTPDEQAQAETVALRIQRVMQGN
jgi:hypothetical protein